MQVILLNDVARVGRRFDVLTVSDGYANNYLFPRKLAERASAAKVATITKRKEAASVAEDARLAEMQEKLKTLGDESVTVTVKADDQGHLFKKVRAEDIVEALKANHALELTKEAILLNAPLSEIGEHTVEVEAVGEKATLHIQIVKE